jgi:hypothetical protein
MMPFLSYIFKQYQATSSSAFEKLLYRVKILSNHLAKDELLLKARTLPQSTDACEAERFQ